MKAILMSIQPKWCELIASGKKTVEVRKTRPKLDTPFKVYIYCTKPKHYYKISGCMAATDENLYLSNGKVKMSDGFEFWANDVEYERLNGKVIGEFVCKELTYIGADFDRDGIRHLYNTAFIENRMCIELDELFDYLYPKGGWGWHISDLVIYDKPKELSEFKKINRDCWYADLGLAKRDCPECKNSDCFLTIPPQSWCYVEGVVE